MRLYFFKKKVEVNYKDYKRGKEDIDRKLFL